MKFLQVAILIVLLLGVAYVLFVHHVTTEPILSKARIEFLVNELTTTPARQQTALDEIVKNEDAAVAYLFRYLDDKRPLATSNVKFLNTQAQPIEKYYLTVSSSVDELTLRYLCWRTIGCDAGFDVNDKKSKDVQREKLVKLCESRYAKASQSCPLNLKK